MKSTEEEAIRIGGQIARGLLPALETFISVLARPEFKGYKLPQIVDAINSHYSYTKADEFFKDLNKKGVNDFEDLDISTIAYFKKFDHLATQYGLRYYYQTRPKNLNDIINKQEDLTHDEILTLKTWTVEKDGKRVPIPDDFKITFATKDLSKVSAICNDLKTYREQLLQKKLDKAASKNASVMKKRSRTIKKKDPEMEKL